MIDFLGYKEEEDDNVGLAFHFNEEEEHKI